MRRTPLAVATLLMSSIAFAAPATTRPAAAVAEKAAERVAEKAAAKSAKPATAPATTQAAKFPTPAEIIAKMKAAKAETDALPKVAHISIAKQVTERPVPVLFFAEADTLTLRSLLDRIKKSGDDKDVKAVLVTLGADANLSLAQAQEVKAALATATKAGKRTFVYADAYTTPTYIAATGASDVCLLTGGELTLPGVNLDTMFLKGLLDKVGVKADFIQIGEFKGADEELTRTGPSDALRGELNKLADGMYAQVVDTIAAGRKLSKDDVIAAIDQTLIPADDAKKRKLVDHVTDLDGLRKLMEGQLKAPKLNIVAKYGEKTSDVDFSNPFAFFQLMMKRPDEGTGDKDAIALVYVDGVISDGNGEGGMFSDDGAGSDSLRRALRTVVKDDKIKAVVVRIDSPGGSAIASEAIWQSVRRVAKDKPVVVSIGSMAASGGYYIASAADTIYADPSAIVGSIGVVGGKIVWSDLMGKIGVTTETFARGANADLYSSTRPFSEKQREMITRSMKKTYDQFTNRVMTTRKGKIADIDKVARGRIFVAANAKQLGMVDHLGGLQDAIAATAKKADLKDGDYDIRVFPAQRTLADMFGADGSETRTPIDPKVAQAAMLRLLPAAQSKLFTQQLQVLHLLDRHPVILATPFSVRVR